MTYETAGAFAIVMFSFAASALAVAWGLRGLGIFPTRLAVSGSSAEAEFAARQFVDPPKGSEPRSSPQAALPLDRLHKAFYGRFDQEQRSIEESVRSALHQRPDLSYQEAWLTTMMAWTPRAMLEAIAEVSGEPTGSP